MSGVFNEFQVRLYRDGPDTTWGFRLQGGSDFKTPLTVQRVFACTPSEGELQRGDIILHIQSKNVENSLHKEAQDLIKNAGASLLLKIRRGGAIRPPLQQRASHQVFQPQPTPAPVYSPPSVDMGSRGGGRIPAVATQVARAPQFGVDYSSKQQQSEEPSNFATDYSAMRKASNVDRQTPPRESDYLYAPVGEIKKKFGGVRGDNVDVKRTGKRWQPPDPSATGGERGLTYGWSTSVKRDDAYQAGPPSDLYRGSQQPARVIRAKLNQN